MLDLCIFKRLCIWISSRGLCRLWYGFQLDSWC